MKVNRANRWERFCRTVYQKVDLQMEARDARKSCRRQLVGFNGGLNGDRKLFKSEVLSFWRKYGIKPSKKWFDVYGFKDGHYNPYYIPGDLYWTKIYPAVNKVNFRQAYTDKTIYPKMFPELRQPRMILSNSNGCYFDGMGKLVDRSQAITLLKAEKSFVLKPAIYSGEGVDIMFYDRDQDGIIDYDALLTTYGSDFLVQEVVRQHETLASLNESSLNTIRVISFLFQQDVHISSAILRMGADGSRLDNISAGGLSCPIRPDGSLEEKALNRYSEWVTEHPGGTSFSNISIPAYDRIIDTVRQTHKKLPHFKVIGWDFAIDEVSAPVFIEYNGAPALNQVSCGPLFGDLTEAFLDSIFLDKDVFTHKQQNQIDDEERLII